MQDFFTTVTVTIIDADGVIACATSYVAENETLDEVIASVKEDATSNFRDEGGSIICRTIVNVNKVPKPKLPGTVVIAELPEGTDDVTVTATIA